MSSVRLQHNTRGTGIPLLQYPGYRYRFGLYSRSARYFMPSDVIRVCLVIHQTRNKNTIVHISLVSKWKLLFLLKLQCRLIFACFYWAVLLAMLVHVWILVCLSGVWFTVRICSCTHKIFGVSLKLVFQWCFRMYSEVQRSTILGVPLCIFNRVRFEFY